MQRATDHAHVAPTGRSMADEAVRHGAIDLAQGVAVAPGGPFFSGEKTNTGYIRIHFAVSPETAAEVQRRLRR